VPPEFDILTKANNSMNEMVKKN